MSFESSGADYLRRLKADQDRPVACPSPPANSISQTATAAPAQDSHQERRQHPRLKCEGSAEFRVGGTDVRTWGTFTDLSLNGCYVEMTATFPVGATVELNLELNGLQVQTRGEVRVSYPFLGIGIAFREMSGENRSRLQEMVRSLLPQLRVGVAKNSAGSVPSGPVAVIGSPAAALQALADFFQTHMVMTKDEFLQVIRASQKSTR